MMIDTKTLTIALAASAAALLLASPASAELHNAGNRSFQRMCPKHIAGDREFGGNGPEVIHYVGLKSDSSHRLAILDVLINWQETKSNWTEAELDQELVLAEAPPNRPFTHVWARDRDGVWAWQAWTALNFDIYLDDYVDDDHSVDKFYPSTLPDTGVDKAWWVSELHVNGDTWGNDVGNCTDGDAYASVFLGSLWLWYPDQPVLATATAGTASRTFAP